MFISYLIASVLLLTVLLLLILGFETVGFKLSEALTIFVVSSAIYLTSSLSILLYFRGWIGFGLVDVTYKIFNFQNIIFVRSGGNLAVGFDIAGFLIPFVISLKMIADRRSPILPSVTGVAVVVCCWIPLLGLHTRRRGSYTKHLCAFSRSKHRGNYSFKQKLGKSRPYCIRFWLTRCSDWG